ncbi:MAG: pPPM1a [Clostridiaceae bacterium]|nr:pPPM1a [Clostridiaceae bacterium]
MNFDGVPLFIPNDISIQTTEFYISYNDRDTSLYGDVTTALVQNNPVKFLILNGNHSKEYKEIISKGGGYSDCLEYFKNNLDKKSKFSENWDETIIVEEDGSLHVVKDFNN